MQRHQHLEALCVLVPSAALRHHGHRPAEQCARCSGAQRDKGMWLHVLNLAFQPVQARSCFTLRRRFVNNKVEYLKASVRAKVEHPFRVIRHQFGYVRMRYQGPKKNTAQLLTLFTLSNLWIARGKLLATPKAAVVDRMDVPAMHSGRRNARCPDQIDLHMLGTPAS